MVSHCLDEVAGGGDGQQDGAGVVVPVDDPPFFLVRNADIRGQAEGFQPLQQAILIKGHHLRGPAGMPGVGLPHPEVPVIARLGEFQSADSGDQRKRVVAIPHQAIFQCRADSERQAAILDEDQVGM
jgi:hypothetical protein